MRKQLLTGEVKSVETDNPNGEFEVVLSAPTVDRDGEVIDAKAFEPLPEHITFDIDHGLSTATTVGSGAPFYDGDLLKVRGTFSSILRAQEVRTLVAEGHIRTTSVAFMGAKKEVKDGVPHITKAELLNGAFVPVPSNREAIVLFSKAGARNSATDLELIQGAHDNLVGVGATCEGAKSVRRAAGKTMVGSFEERQEEIREGLQAAYPDAWWVSVIATFDDRVIYEVYGGANDDQQFETTYTFDGATVAFGTATAVQVNEVATPVANGARAVTSNGGVVSERAPEMILPAHRSANTSAGSVTINVTSTTDPAVIAAKIKKSVEGDATGAAASEQSSREDATGADGDDEQQQLELRARALQLLARSVT